jgi:hypothetical protein
MENPTHRKMKTIITNSHSMGERMNWEHGEHSGTITFPGEERGPVDIQWDGDCPDDWEEIEAAVEAAAVDRLYGADESADEKPDGQA